MATGTGIDRQIGYVRESAYGVGPAVSRFLPAISDSLSKSIDATESSGQIAGAQVLRSTQWTQGNATVGGDVQHEMYTQSMGLLLEAALGTVTTSGTAVPYTHTFTPAVPKTSLRVQVGRPATYGSVIPFTYVGAKVQSWSLGVQPGEIVTWGAAYVAQEETSGTAIATPSYSANLTPWHAKDATLTIAGTAVPVKSFSLSGANSVTEDRRYIGSTIIAEPLRGDLAAYTGSVSVEWGNPSTFGTLLYQRFLQGTESALVCTLAAGTLAGTITANVRFDGSTPSTSGNGIVMHEIPFKCIASGTLDSTALSIVLKNNDSAA